MPCIAGSADPRPDSVSSLPSSNRPCVIPHTAFQDRSPRRCRRCRCPGYGSTEVIDTECSEEVRAVDLPAPPRSLRLLLQEQAQPLADVLIHRPKDPGGVPSPEVGAPAPQQSIELVHELTGWLGQSESRGRDRLDLSPDPLPRPCTRPGLEIPFPSPAPGLHLPVVEPQEVE